MLNDADVSAMIPVKDLKAAKDFYANTLELGEGKEGPAGIAYNFNNGKLFVYVTPKAGTAESTAATWEVDDIEAVVKKLGDKGIKFEHYDSPETKREGDIHIWGPMKAAWFKDPDGNILGLVNKT